jgi:hypothetical protein
MTGGALRHVEQLLDAAGGPFGGKCGVKWPHFEWLWSFLRWLGCAVASAEEVVGLFGDGLAGAKGFGFKNLGEGVVDLECEFHVSMLRRNADEVNEIAMRDGRLRV